MKIGILREEKFPRDSRGPLTPSQCKFLIERNPDIKIVVQIARGRAGKLMYDEVLKQIFERLQITNITIVYGYRTPDYYKPSTRDNFVFVNIEIGRAHV